MQGMDVFGKALRAYQEGALSCALTVHEPDGSVSAIPVAVFFRAPQAFDIDSIALNRCWGRTLDIGAGTGIHARYLQDRGLDVVALDVSAEACQIMQAHGIQQVVCADIVRCDFQNEFQTYLVLGRSIGAVGSLSGFEQFLRQAKRALYARGQIILNSTNEAAKDCGHIRTLRFEFAGEIGPSVAWFDIGEDLLTQLAKQAGFETEIANRDESGNYLAILTLMENSKGTVA